MSDEGIELVDAGVDGDGNVQRPMLAEGAQASREDYEKAMNMCGKYLEGLTRGREHQDVSGQVDKLVDLSACLREKGYAVEDPTAETLDQWGKDLRVAFDWNDAEAQVAYEECSDSK